MEMLSVGRALLELPEFERLASVSRKGIEMIRVIMGCLFVYQ
jgi:hypothetical protein